MSVKDEDRIVDKDKGLTENVPTNTNMTRVDLLGSNRGREF